MTYNTIKMQNQHVEQLISPSWFHNVCVNIFIKGTLHTIHKSCSSLTSITIIFTILSLSNQNQCDIFYIFKVYDLFLCFVVHSFVIYKFHREGCRGFMLLLHAKRVIYCHFILVPCYLITMVSNESITFIWYHSFILKVCIHLN